MTDSISGSPAAIRNLSDTALWAAIYRAMESERPDAIFHDRFARRLGGERGEAIVRSLPRAQAMAWAMIVRTALFDEIILRCVDQGARAVINLAAGLDTRPYRLELPADLTWLHVDLPDMVETVRERLSGETPRCALEFVVADLADGAARQRVWARTEGRGPVLVVSEGLLVYLEPAEVAALAAELHDQPSFRWWLLDLASPRLLKMLVRRWGSSLAGGNASMKFAPAEGTAFFAPHGWREREFRSTWDESFRLKRTITGGRLFRLLGRLASKRRQEEDRRMAGTVLLERT